MVRDRRVDADAVERRTPLHAALITAGTEERVPDELSGLRVEERVDAALASESDDVAPMSTHSHPHDVHAGAADIPFLPVGFGCAPRHRERLTAARLQPRTMALYPVRPPWRARLQVERDDGFQVRPRLLARFCEAAVSRVAGGDARRFRVRLPERAVDEACRKVDRGRREHRGAGVTSGKAAVVRKRGAPPQDAARLRVESNVRAAEGGIWAPRPGSRHAGVNGVTSENRRAGHDPLRVRMNLCNPAELPGRRVDP